MSESGNSTHLQFLIEQVLDGKTNAFDQLAIQSTARLKTLTRAMLRNYPRVQRWEDTDDVFQSVLIRLHRSISEVRPDTTRAYFGLAVTQIRRSLIDLSRHYYGAHGHGKHYRTDGNGKAHDDSGGILQRQANRRPENLAGWAEFHSAIDELPESEREVFGLIWYGGLKRKDVAKLLGVAEKTVLRRFNRARIQLVELTSAQGPELE